MLIISKRDLVAHWQAVGLEAFVKGLSRQMFEAFKQWEQFDQCPRLAMHHHEDLFELMPTLGPDYFSYKYVNGHRHNMAKGLPTVVGLGMLADKATGIPLMLCEMTLLTAWRTAVVSAMATVQMVPKRDYFVLGIVGTGAQSEFQVLAHHWQLPIEKVVYFDVDAKAMEKFAGHMQAQSIAHEAAKDIESVFAACDIVITSTVPPDHEPIVEPSWCRPGMHIAAVGGDSPYKRELAPEIIQNARVVVEYWDQSAKEGEVKGCDRSVVHAELWELVQGLKPGRLNDEEITVFDSVGIALEDYATLAYVYDCLKDQVNESSNDLIPDLNDPKDLFGLNRHPGARQDPVKKCD